MFIIHRERMELLSIPEQHTANNEKHQQQVHPNQLQRQTSSEFAHAQEHITSNHGSDPQCKKFDFLQEVSLLDLDVLEICSAAE
jgi:hypothetical protein